MKPEFEPKRFLDDVLEEAAPRGFRAALLDRTLREVRRKRRVRALNRLVLVCALFIGLWAFWKARVPERASIEAHPTEAEGEPAFGIVHSQPVDPAWIVQTRLGTAQVVNSSPRSIAMVETVPEERWFREITDDELLILLAERPAMLVRHGPHDVELIFMNPEDQQGFPVQ